MTSPDPAITRFRLLAVCALLTGLAFIQAPGLLTADTKFDLAIAPGRFLERALHLWDAQGALGQLQNQAYGYLWPMGPFHLAGYVLDLPGWVVQRLWLALVLCVAFVGVAKVARALGVRSDLACVVAGLAYALSPRMLTTLGPISIEAWPGAVAPWVLLPLVIGSTRGSPRAAAALSALAVAMVGGVNAAATFAVLPVGAVWLLTRSPGARRRALMTWWPVFTLLGTLWWLVPLFLMGAYSPPFLDYIETTTVTTFPTDLFDALRGTSNWVPYVTSDSRAGNDLIVQGFLALSSGVLLFVGFAGLLMRHNPHRHFLGLSLLVGVLMVTAGHQGAVQGWFSGDLAALLDGVLAPLRNVHKFDPVIRLPLVLGLAFVLGGLRVAQKRPVTPSRQDPSAPGSKNEATDRLETGLVRTNQASVLGLVLISLVASSSPALVGRIAPANAVQEVPAYWQQAADWLDARQADHSSLLVPGSAFADYLWGSPRDEPLQYLSDSSWTVRNQIPLTPPGNIRMLSEIEQRLAQGRGSAGLTGYLRRAGLRYLVVRNDLRRDSDVPDPVLVHQALADSPGIRRVRSFGPDVGGGAHLIENGTRVVINGGWQTLYPAIEVFEVPGATRQGRVTGAPAVVVGGPEDLLDLGELDVGDVGDVVLAPDVPGMERTGPLAEGRLVLTDGLRARETFFPRLHDNQSPVLAPGDVARSGNPSPDYLTPEQDRWLTRARLEGAASVSASSSGSDPNAFGGSRRGRSPYAALDGAADTEWVTDVAQEGRGWWRVDLVDDRSVATVRLTGGASADENQVVRVVTEDETSDFVDLAPGETTEVTLEGGPTGFVRIEQSRAAAGRRFALAEVEVPGLAVTRRLVVPETPEDWGSPDAIVLRPDLDVRQGCASVGGDVRCTPAQERGSEEPVQAAREVTLPSAQSFEADLRVRPRPGDALEALLQTDQPVGVSASSSAVADPRASAVAAIDGNPGTTWIADPDDLVPTLSVQWLQPRPVTGITVRGSDDAAARLPTRVTLTWPKGERSVRLDSRGTARFPVIRTDRLQIRVDAAETATNIDFNATGSTLGVGIGELELAGVPDLPLVLSQRPVELGCGSGPDLLVNGETLRSSVTASAAELFAGAELPARTCAAEGQGTAASSTGQPVDLRAGENDLTMVHAPAFDLVSTVLRSSSRAAGATVSTAETRYPGPTELTLRFEPGAAVVGVPQNFNAGWEAQSAGRGLSPIVLDGWKQGWVVRDRPGASGERVTVTARFAPDGIYRAGLVVGALALLGLIAALLVLRRRRRDADLPPLPGRPGSLPLALAALTAATGLVAGWAGLLVAVPAAALAFYLQARAPQAAPWVLAAPCLVVAVAFYVNPWGDPSGWAGNAAWTSYLMLVPVVAVLVPATDLPKFFSRIAGASIRR